MVKTTIEIDVDLWRRFSLLVLPDKGQRKKNEVITMLLRDYVKRRGFVEDPQQLDHVLRLEEEREAFLSFRDRLVQDRRYAGKFVAVFRGGVIQCDEEKGRLAENVYRNYGYFSTYIDSVSLTERRLEAPSPELTRRGIQLRLQPPSAVPHSRPQRTDL